MKTNRADRSRGFTLIELMIVVAIIAILAAIAVPSYSRYVQRTRRSDAQQILLQVAGSEERYYGTNNTYGNLTDIGYSSNSLPSAHGYYTVALSTASSSAFTATATPVAGGPQASDSCGALSISDTGAKTSAAATSNGSCW